MPKLTVVDNVGPASRRERAGKTDKPWPPGKRSKNKSKQVVAGNATALTHYFRDMGELAVLRPHEEFEFAQALENAEIKLWKAILQNPWTRKWITFFEQATGQKLTSAKRLGDFRLADGKMITPSSRSWDRTLDRLSHELRTLDPDKEVLAPILHEIGSHQFAEGQATAYAAAVSAAAAVASHAKNQFVRANLRLVVALARRFPQGRLPLADLIQEGNIGLLKAVDRFDHRRGYRFSTYASWWIRHAISRALADKGRSVRLPVHMLDTYHRISRATNTLTQTLGRAPTREELACAAEISLEKYDKMATYLTDESSLDRPFGDSDDRKLLDRVEDPESHDEVGSEGLIESELAESLQEEMASLRPMEADILRQRFGFGSDEERTLKEIGVQYHLSRERIRQLQEQAIGKIRRAFARKNLL